MSLKRILLGIALLILGVFAIRLGDIDDAPGASLIGIVVIGIGVYLLVKGTYKVIKSKK